MTPPREHREREWCSLRGGWREEERRGGGGGGVEKGERGESVRAV